MDELNSLEPRPLTPQHQMHPLAALWSMIGGVLLLVFLIAGIIAARQQFIAGATFVVYILIAILIVVAPGTILAAIFFLWKNQQRKARIAELEIERAEAAIRREDEINSARVHQINTQTEVLRRTVAFDHVGNAAIVDSYGQIMQLRGNYQQLPNLSSMHYSIKNDTSPSVKVSEVEQNLLAGPAVRDLPRIEQFYDLIKFNSLQTAMGIEAATGQPVIVPIRKSTHFKLIGGSGLGKSCLAAGILDIAAATNDPDHLKIGLLDLEHNTSRLFENLPHIAELGPRRARLIGRDPDEVAQKLKLLQAELTRRANLGEEHCTLHEPVLLVYVEEMLALKYEVVDEKLKKEMLAAINILGVRARKYGIFLLVCMQTDYSDKSTREAMAQFRTRAGFAVDPDSARASGFFNTELVKQNFLEGRSGQYVLEKPQYSNIVLAHDYDVATKLERLHAPTIAPMERENIRLLNPGHSTPVGESVGDFVEDEQQPLPSASQASLEAFSAQEQRIIRKFTVEQMGVGQIVSSEFTNSKGAPLVDGNLYTKRSKEVQDVLRRYLAAKEAM